MGYRVRFGDLHLNAGLANGYNPDHFSQVEAHREDSLPTSGLGTIIDLSDRLEARVNYDLEKGDQDRLEKFSAKVIYKM